LSRRSFSTGLNVETAFSKAAPTAGTNAHTTFGEGIKHGKRKSLGKIPFARVYCKKACREGFLLAVVKSVGNNIHVDF